MLDYAIVELGGRQVWVEPGFHIATKKLDFEPGTFLTFNRVILAHLDGTWHSGKPYVETAKVIGEVVEHKMSPKVVFWSMNSRKKYRRKVSNRQPLTRIFIKHISV